MLWIVMENSVSNPAPCFISLNKKSVLTSPNRVVPCQDHKSTWNHECRSRWSRRFEECCVLSHKKRTLRSASSRRESWIMEVDCMIGHRHKLEETSSSLFLLAWEDEEVCHLLGHILRLSVNMSHTDFLWLLAQALQLNEEKFIPNSYESSYPFQA